MIFEKKLEATPELDLITWRFLGDSFPMYYYHTVGVDSLHQYSHSLLSRNPSGEPIEGVSPSEYFNYGKYIFDEFCKQNNIQYKAILRAAVNSVFYSKTKIKIHTDHTFEHQVFIFYLNDVTDGETVIFEKDEKTLIRKVKPEKYKGLIFPGLQPHAVLSPGLDERRMVLVVTFV